MALFVTFQKNLKKKSAHGPWMGTTYWRVKKLNTNQQVILWETMSYKNKLSLLF